jgi:two-component system, NarL family, sensor histidine kinase EvgS
MSPISINLKEVVKSISNSTNLLTTIISDILDLSKIESRKMSLNIEEFNILETIEQSINMNVNQIYNKGLTIFHYFDFSLPLTVKTDKSKLIQMMNNFISNATKYTKNGEIQIRTFFVDSKKFRFECSDTGIGISKENLDFLFRPFEQVHEVSSSPTKYVSR